MTAGCRVCVANPVGRETVIAQGAEIVQRELVVANHVGCNLAATIADPACEIIVSIGCPLYPVLISRMCSTAIRMIPGAPVHRFGSCLHLAQISSDTVVAHLQQLLFSGSLRCPASP